MERIQRKSGIELEVISSEEEARLVCSAVRWALGDRIQPRVIFDLGGGSLEINFLERGEAERARRAAARNDPVDGNVLDRRRDRRRQARSGCGMHILSLLRSAMPSPPKLSRAIGVACGGNAEALVRLAPGPMVGRTPTINVRLLKDQTLAAAAPRRAGPHARVSRAQRPRRSDGHRGDHYRHSGEVARPALDSRARGGRARGAAARSRRRAILGRRGVRGGKRPRRGVVGRGAVVRAAASTTTRSTPSRSRASPFRFSISCARSTSLGRITGCCLKSRAMLHDIGHFVHRKSHNRHGEYLIRNSEIPGLARLAARHGGRARPLPQLQIGAAGGARLLRRARWLAAARDAPAHFAAAHRRKTRIGARAARGGCRRPDRRASRDFPDPGGRRHAARCGRTGTQGGALRKGISPEARSSGGCSERRRSPKS